jgi:hypothetical protein
MLDFIGAIGVGVFAATALAVFTGTMQTGLGARLVLAAVVGIWIGLAGALAGAGAFDDAGRRPVPLVAVFVVTPLLVVALLAWLSPAARKAMLSVPMPLLVGLNAFRFLGGLFLLLAAAGRLGGPFPYSAGWGDIAAAALALPAAYIAARPPAGRDWFIGLATLIGALDLIAAVGLATITTPGSPLQIIPETVGPRAMVFLPWTLIPTVLVPYMLIAHGIVFAQLRKRDSR